MTVRSATGRPENRRAVFFSSGSRHTRSKRDWSSVVCSSDLSPDLRAQSAMAVLAGLSFMRRVGDVDFAAFDRTELIDHYAEIIQRIVDGHEYPSAFALPTDRKSVV